MADSTPRLVVLRGVDLPIERVRAALAPDVEVIGPQTSSDGADWVLAPASSAPAQASDVIAAISVASAILGGSGNLAWSDDGFAALPEEARRAILAAARAGAMGPLEIELPESRRTLEVLVAPVPGERDSEIAVLVRDTTEQRKFGQQAQALDRAGADLLRVDADVVREMNAVERLHLLEGKIVRVAHDLLHIDHFVVRLIDEKSRRLETVICRGVPTDVADLELYPETTGSGVSGYVAATGRSYICNDTSSDALFLPGMAGAASSLTVPLRLGDQVVGIMDIESAKANAFTERDRELAEMFGRHIAVALHILDLLVIERSATNLSTGARVQGELTEPLDDILAETEALLSEGARADPVALAHLERIRRDVEAIRGRVRDVAAGPQSLLGVERAMAVRTPDPSLVSRRILVADDELKIRRVIGDVLRHRGADVTVCASGGEAIAALDAAPRPFDLVISDIKMPDRNGYEVFSAAKRHDAFTPVILMTGFGYDPHHSIVRASQEGLQTVLFKPFQIERLIDEVHKALAPRAPGDSA